LQTEGSYFGKLKPEQCEIKIADGIRRAYNLIRGVSKPYFGAYIYNENKKIIIWRAEIINDKPEAKTGNITFNNGKSYLSFNDGTLLITKYETNSSEGASKQL
jgi:methionyl-tRNA formyltransferase